MTEEAPPDVKRRRIAADGACSQVIRHLTDLPSGILAHAASFLVDPSRALFAIALDENSATINERSSAIVGNQLDTLDLGEVEKEVAENLTDTDVKGVLQCIDAVHKIKRLKLTNCVAITGTCLEPLRGSLVIEQIDLSLVGDKYHPDLNLTPLISCDHVLPILDSIIEREGCALKYLHVPSMWRKEQSAESEFHAFILRYNQMYVNRGAITCLECNTQLPPDGIEWLETDADFYGTQSYVCYGCLNHYCYECSIVGEAWATITMMRSCCSCYRNYCKGCINNACCSFCHLKTWKSMLICNECCKYECLKCNTKICNSCVRDLAEIRCKRVDYTSTRVICSRCDAKDEHEG